MQRRFLESTIHLRSLVGIFRDRFSFVLLAEYRTLAELRVDTWSMNFFIFFFFWVSESHEDCRDNIQKFATIFMEKYSCNSKE